jgi:hypothetical protein
MKAHEPKTALFWADVERKSQQNPLTQADYEEWRANPVTMALYDDLERLTLTTQTELASMVSTEPSAVFAAQQQMLGMSDTLGGIFEWSPQGIELEADEYDS